MPLMSSINSSTSMMYFTDIPVYLFKATPVLGTNTYVHAAVTQPSAGTTSVSTAITNPDVPRNLLVKGNQASCTGNVVVTGTDIEDRVITETIALNGTAAVTGLKAFKTVTGFVVPTRGAAGDTVSIGTSTALGLPLPVSYDSVLVGWVAGVREATKPTMTGSTTDIALSTVSFTSAYNGSSEVAVTFMAV